MRHSARTKVELGALLGVGVGAVWVGGAGTSGLLLFIIVIVRPAAVLVLIGIILLIGSCND